VTPVWAGRLWSLYKNGKPLFYDSKVMQPTNDALRQAYVEVRSPSTRLPFAHTHQLHCPPILFLLDQHPMERCGCTNMSFTHLHTHPSTHSTHPARPPTHPSHPHSIVSHPPTHPPTHPPNHSLAHAPTHTMLLA
jgi:hypothetical protein